MSAELPTAYPRTYSGPIASFVDSRLQESVMQAAASLAPDERFAVVTGIDTHGQFRLAGVARMGDGWSAVGVFEHAPSSGWGAEVGVRKAWK